MAREPSYPDDAPVGKPAEKATPPEEIDSDSGDKSLDERVGGSSRTRHIVTGAAIGIGSAALVAALLYANRSRKGGTDDRN